MKKAFTLAEVLITLTVIGVVFAITIPVLNNSKPDKDKTIYKKAIFSTTGAMSNIMDEDIITRDPEMLAGEYASESTFCELFSDALNTVGTVNCTSVSSYNSPNFITSDGIRFWGLEGKVFDLASGTKERTIHTDRKLTSKEISRLSSLRDSDHSNKNTGLRIKVYYDGLVRVDNNWTYEHQLLEKE